MSTNRIRLAYELFSASFFSDYVDSKFILFMTAIETLIQQNERPTDELEQIDKLIENTRLSWVIAKESLIGSLRNLKTESIVSAGRRLASKITKNYMGMIPFKFFDRCYEVRNKSVHGAEPRPMIQEVGGLIGDLEQLVSDLICLPSVQSDYLWASLQL